MNRIRGSECARRIRWCWTTPALDTTSRAMPSPCRRGSDPSQWYQRRPRAQTPHRPGSVPSHTSCTTSAASVFPGTLWFDAWHRTWFPEPQIRCGARFGIEPRTFAVAHDRPIDRLSASGTKPIPVLDPMEHMGCGSYTDSHRVRSISRSGPIAPAPPIDGQRDRKRIRSMYGQSDRTTNRRIGP